MHDELPVCDPLSLLLPLWSTDGTPAGDPPVVPRTTVVVTAEALVAQAPAVARIAAAGSPVLGYVDLAYATRSPADLRRDVARLAAAALDGVFIDRAPTTPYAIGPVALAVRAAQRAGLRKVIVNPGLPADPIFDTLAAAICTFEGTWGEYRRMPDAEFRPGGGHLVHGIPADDLPAARELVRRRRAAFGFASDRRAAGPYRLEEPPAVLAAAR